jgi:hypothetical protein
VPKLANLLGSPEAPGRKAGATVTRLGTVTGQHWHTNLLSRSTATYGPGSRDDDEQPAFKLFAFRVVSGSNLNLRSRSLRLISLPGPWLSESGPGQSRSDTVALYFWRPAGRPEGPAGWGPGGPLSSFNLKLSESPGPGPGHHDLIDNQAQSEPESLTPSPL